MVLEADLLDPLADWFREAVPEGVDKLLIHEEPQGRGGRRPDMLVIDDRTGSSVDEATIQSVEIERSSRGALRDARGGLRQLRRYVGNAAYLAIPRTVRDHPAGREIPPRCVKFGSGLLVVDLTEPEVELEVEPTWYDSPHSLRFYPSAMKRWLALRESADSYRRIRHRRILEAE